MPRWGKTVPLPGGGVAFVDGSTSRRRYCGCGRVATLQCDYPDPKRKSGTCDRHVCRTCAVSVGPDRDYCQHHTW
jgi:hypothetical protein